jgi:hypothetical protein
MKNKTKVISIFLSFSALMMIISCQQQKAEWRGTIEEVDGIIVVKNPKEPIYPDKIVTFEEELTIGKSEGPEEYLINFIRSFAIDDEGNTYILDIRPYRIKVFDEDGKYLRSIGRSGQGPGELQGPRNIQFTVQKEIMVNDSRKGALLFFSVDGRFLREIKSPTLRSSNNAIADATGNIYIGKYSFGEGEDRLIKLSHTYENLEVLATKSAPLREDIPPPQIRYFLLPRNNLVWGFSSEYEFNIVDSEGRLIKKIEKEHSLVRVTDEYKSKYFERLPPGISKESQKFSTNFPAFDFFFSDDEGRLFVKTYEKLEATNKYIFDVFDSEGKFLTRTELNVSDEISLFQDKFIIKNNKLYSKELTEDGFPALRRYRIIWNFESED